MNSFAFWCRRRGVSSSENAPISAKVNVNLWVDRIHERQAATQAYLDFGLMLSRSKEKGEEKALPDAAGVPLIGLIGGIAL